MAKTFVNDTPLISLDLNSPQVDSLQLAADLLTATSLNILATFPDGTELTWPGTLSGTKIEYQVQPGELSQPGLLKFNADVWIGGRHFTGDTCRREIFSRGS